MSIRSKHSVTAKLAAATLVVSGLALIGTATTVGAQADCGQFSYGFAGTRLLNDGISDSAGPFAIELPAGTYDIVMRSHDAHDEHPGQFEQTMESWFFELDSGYTSPFTVDVPDDANTSMTSVGAVEIAESRSITVRHRGEGGINSVDPICVGFTPVEVAGPPVTTAAPTPTTVAAPPPTNDVAGGSTIPQVSPPVATTEAPEVEGVVQVAPPEQLALTGPSSAMLLMVTGGLSMILIGAGIVLDERRTSRLRSLKG